jgi:murein L,D-transpeptidase YafK
MKAIQVILLLTFFLNINCLSNFKKNEDKKPLDKHIIIDSIVVKKADRILIVFSNKKEIKQYNIALGKNPVGHKQFEGDMKTPEGLYIIDTKSAYSKFHKNLNISYPNQKDIAYAVAHGKKPGGDIKIHGLPNNYEEKNYERTDWTWGCIALTNTEIDELYEHVKLNCKILILP